MDTKNGFAKAGFWIRLLATWVDGVIIYVLLKAVFYLLVYTAPALYFPFNFTFFVTGLVYSVVLITWKGQTLGKYLLGISVQSTDGTRLPFVRVLWRESVLKCIAAVVLFAGFLWIGFSKNKKGWHDYLSKSEAVQQKKSYTPYWSMIAAATFALFFLNYTWNFTGLVMEAKKMSLSSPFVTLPFMERNPSTLTDIAGLKDSSFTEWLNKNAVSPEAYAIQVAATHQVTLFGEEHENADNLNFFNRILPSLYHHSGVRVIGMEIIPYTQNTKLEKLITAKIYDTALAMDIARSQCWKIWGMKEYWDVLKTVWQLNRSLPDTAVKMRIVGLDGDWIMPNLSLLGISEDSKGKTAFWEKFRVFSAIEDFPKFAYRDNIMARSVEKEIINKHQKAVIWIGINHTLLNFATAEKKDNKTFVTNSRFAFLLNQKYRNTFSQVVLHQRTLFSEGDDLCTHSIAHFMDSVMIQRGSIPAGFTVAGSPFEKLRDSCLSIFKKYPALCYGDITQGFIFLKPLGKHTECTWIPGYITNEMFMNYKPLYYLVFRKNSAIKFSNAAELNDVLVKYMGENNKK